MTKEIPIVRSVTRVGIAVAAVLATALAVECLSAPASVNQPLALAWCGASETMWHVIVKSDSYNCSGHEVWQIQNNTSANKCIVAGNADYATLALGSCEYSGSVHNKFEIFHESWNGKSVDQLKDIEA